GGDHRESGDARPRAGGGRRRAGAGAGGARTEIVKVDACVSRPASSKWSCKRGRPGGTVSRLPPGGGPVHLSRPRRATDGQDAEPHRIPVVHGPRLPADG